MVDHLLAVVSAMNILIAYNIHYPRVEISQFSKDRLTRYLRMIIYFLQYFECFARIKLKKRKSLQAVKYIGYKKGRIRPFYASRSFGPIS